MAVAIAADPDWAPCGHCDCRDGVSQIPDKWEIPGVLKTSECPRRLITPTTWEMIKVGALYRDGHLWTAGGISDQPAVYLDAMQFIQSMVSRVQK